MAADKMPDIVRALCWGFDAWIVGSGAAAIIGGENNPSDWDVIVPPDKWCAAALTLRTHPIIPNYFGGWKLGTSPELIDVWPSTLEAFVKIVPSTYKLQMFTPKSRTILTRTFKEKDNDRRELDNSNRLTGRWNQARWCI